MSRYRLLSSPAQQVVLRDHCAQARFVWNLAVEQHRHWRPGRKSAPGYLEQCRQLTQARGEQPWLAAGSQMVQQQALRDGRVEKIKPHFTSQRCSACGHVDPKSRQSQARFVCTTCSFTGHADVNAGRNMAAGHPTRLPSPLHARGGDGAAQPVNREPQLLLQKA
ncbi:MAG: zinc ribbon domain-containing protein [Streptosporangiaceae bacterium]